jgi:hypothetical protein
VYDSTASTRVEAVLQGGLGIRKTSSACSGFSNCIYEFNEQVGVLEGPLLTDDNGHITFQEVPLERVSGILCPSEVKFDALFEASEPVYVSS